MKPYTPEEVEEIQGRAHRNAGIYDGVVGSVVCRLIITLKQAQFPPDQVPGAWWCPKCDFQLAKAILYTKSGNIGADTVALVPERCPNDGQIMQPLSWRHVAQNLSGMASAALGREKKLLDTLTKIAAWLEGPEVTGHFDEPVAARLARAVLLELDRAPKRETEAAK